MDRMVIWVLELFLSYCMLNTNTDSSHNRSSVKYCDIQWLIEQY